MSEITRVGVDLAKQVIQVHAVDRAARPVLRRQLPRSKFMDWCAKLPGGCEVVMEACTGAHHWARQLSRLGLKVRLLAPHLVAPYRPQGRSGKNDANDAAAICEAASRPHLHSVPVKTVEQQALMAVHTLREGLQAERTACMNRIRGTLAEFGVVLPQGAAKLRARLPQVLEDGTTEVPGRLRQMVLATLQHWRNLDELIAHADRQITEHARQEPRAREAQKLPGIGPVSASALVATVADFRQFKSAHQFVSWLGLAPSQNSSGGKARLGKITKRGNRYLRMLLVQGAKSAIHAGKPKDTRLWRWLQALVERAGWQKAAVALAAKNARSLWAMFAKGVPYNPHHVSVKPA